MTQGQEEEGEKGDRDDTSSVSSINSDDALGNLDSKKIRMEGVSVDNNHPLKDIPVQKEAVVVEPPTSASSAGEVSDSKMGQ